MSDLTWDDLRLMLDPDGSLVDAYVFGTTMADWQRFTDLVRSCGWGFAYSEGGLDKPLPDRVEGIFSRTSETGVLLQIRPEPTIAIHAHFFGDDEIEVDFSRRELQDQHGLDVLCDFIRAVGRCLDKPVVVTPENGPRHPFVRYDVSTDQIVTC